MLRHLCAIALNGWALSVGVADQKHPHSRDLKGSNPRLQEGL